MNVKIYEICISGTVIVEAENDGEAIEEALAKGADEYYAEVVDSWDVEGE